GGDGMSLGAVSDPGRTDRRYRSGDSVRRFPVGTSSTGRRQPAVPMRNGDAAYAASPVLHMSAPLTSLVLFLRTSLWTGGRHLTVALRLVRPGFQPVGHPVSQILQLFMAVAPVVVGLAVHVLGLLLAQAGNLLLDRFQTV